MDFTLRFSRYLQLLKYVIIIISSITGASATEIRCGKPGRAAIGRYTPAYDYYPVGSTIKYSCEFPRLISKPDQRICQKDGTWSGIIPLCYDRVVVNQFLHSSKLEEKPPSKAADNITTTCFSTAWEKNGHWAAILPSPSTVTAVKIDFPFGASMNVEVTVKEESSREVVCSIRDSSSGMQPSEIYYCPENTGARILQVRDQSSEADFFEICEAAIFVRPVNPCFLPDDPHNGFGTVSISGYERKYVYFCGQGYELLGERESSCTPSRTWTPKAPVCYRIQCMITSSPDNGNVYFEDDRGVVPLHGRANYSCNPGFVLRGSSIRYCVERNKWSGNEPVCMAKRCGLIPTKVANGELLKNSTTVGTVALLACNDGYQPLSDDRIECLASGSWSHASLICAPIRCDPNPMIPHGTFRLLANSTFYGSHLQVVCDRGYVIKNNGLRMCEGDGTWGDLSDVCVEIACDSLPEVVPESGIWHSLNDSFRSTERPIRVLRCYQGYHIVGTPPIVRCLENGSWSFTTATCMKTPEAVMSTAEWSPNAATLFVAAAVGAGAAICLVCAVAFCLRIRKRRHARTNTTLFHVDMSNHPNFRNSHKRMPISPEEHYYTTALYEDLSDNVAYEPPKPRKPSAGLPLLPLDTDPVYAQPFEIGCSMSVVAHKLRKDDSGSREDPYSGHIYAEPIDSRRPPSGSSTVSGCIAETWFRGGTSVKMTRKMSLPDCQQIPKTDPSSSMQKMKGTIGKSSAEFLYVNGTEQQRSQEFTGQLGAQTANSASSGSIGLFAELQSNAIYLRTGFQDSRRSPLSFGFKLADNDIYIDKQFSNV